MKNYRDSMSKTLFVCYAHGCRGENLSHRISQHEYFCKLEAKTINGRTVITNEHFEKRFLMHSVLKFSGVILDEDVMKRNLGGLEALANGAVGLGFAAGTSTRL